MYPTSSMMTSGYLPKRRSSSCNLPASWAVCRRSTHSDLEEEVGGLALKRDVSDLIDDDERVSPQATKFVLQLAGVMGCLQAVDPFRSGRRGWRPRPETGCIRPHR